MTTIDIDAMRAELNRMYSADMAKLRAQVAELTAERDAARDHANTARREAANALRALDTARPVVEAAKPLLDHIDTIRARWVTLLPRDVGESLLALSAALAAAVDALPKAEVTSNAGHADLGGPRHHAPNGCDDCSVEPGDWHRYAGCPGNLRAIERAKTEVTS